MVLGIYGTGGTGREVRDIVELNTELKSKYEEIVFIDDVIGISEFEGLRCMPFKDTVLRYCSILCVNNLILLLIHERRCAA